MKNTYLFTSESVSEGHPDKVADQISDAILDEFLRQDPEAKVACETFCTTGLVLVGGEVSSEHAYVDIERVVRDTISRIGYNSAEYGFEASSCGVLNTIHEQSADIHRGVVRDDPLEQGAGDQGMMFGYACRDTEEYMPLALSLAHRTLEVLTAIRRSAPSPMPYLRPDAKSQYTIEYDSASGMPLRIHTIVISTQHDEFASDEEMAARITEDVRDILIPAVRKTLPAETAALFDGGFRLLVNPTGKFVTGGPAGDTGLTGRKIVVDTYGGRGAHGGGAFSGKDPSKVDRSAAYAARYIAKNLVAAGVSDEILVQLAYAIGVARPIGIFVNSYGKSKIALTDGEIADKVSQLFDLRPASIIEKFGLKNPIYLPTAAYGHFGKKPYESNGMQFFAWEKLDSVDIIRKVFGL
ncbi:MAG: methionine adenosyltransferase [Bacteroidales bacterium]|nr:methionine adenosyltransferase [Bacteroidales bacterium]